MGFLPKVGQGLRHQGVGDTCGSDLAGFLAETGFGRPKTGQRQERRLVEKRAQRSLTKVWSKGESLSEKAMHLH